MFDIDEVRNDLLEKLATTFARCREGRWTSQRGAVARCLLLSEALTVAERHVRDVIKFDPNEFSSYLQTFPKFLSGWAQGDLRDALEQQLRHLVLKELDSSVKEAVFSQQHATNLTELLDILAKDIADDAEPLRQFGAYRLKDALDRCRDDPSDENMNTLEGQLVAGSYEMDQLIRRYDIADPPACDYAGRAKRRFLEAADQISLVLKLGVADEFRNETAGVTP